MEVEAKIIIKLKDDIVVELSKEEAIELLKLLENITDTKVVKEKEYVPYTPYIPRYPNPNPYPFWYPDVVYTYSTTETDHTTKTI